MGYQIHYDGKPVYKGVSQYNRNSGKIVLSVTGVLLLLLCILTPLKEILVQWLIPFDLEITGTAIEGFAEALQRGMPVQDAFMELCKEILING